MLAYQEAKMRLEQERERLLEELGRLSELPRVRTSPGNHPADNATEVSERALNSALREIHVRHLALIEGALRRLAQGTYGICEKCGEIIDPRRLEVQPAARLCVVCQQRLEKPH